MRLYYALLSAAAAIASVLFAPSASGAPPERLPFASGLAQQAETAIRAGNADDLRRLIASGLDVNSESEEVRTAWGRDTVHLLLYAAVLDDVGGMEALLKAGADVNKASKGG